ncbi:MAG: PIN domain-containing protein [Betaproteobacteria bacterium]|jgi:predicted nucleic acid-binding protein|nr:PIN domain-containing protein [Betaproteobacteria bacterium]
MILVDTNVLLDIYKADAIWMPWSVKQLRSAKPGQLAINMVVYAELSAYPTEHKLLDGFLATLSIQVLDLTRPAALLAGKAFRQYRQSGGTKTGVLPDFFIGAHAEAEKFKLLTRDAGRYKTYFPKIKLICP